MNIEELYNSLNYDDKRKFIIKHLKDCNQYDILECLSIDCILEFINDIED